MRMFRKAYSLALIFMLVGLWTCQNLYAIRVPIGDYEAIKNVQEEKTNTDWTSKWVSAQMEPKRSRIVHRLERLAQIGIINDDVLNSLEDPKELILNIRRWREYVIENEASFNIVRKLAKEQYIGKKTLQKLLINEGYRFEAIIRNISIVSDFFKAWDGLSQEGQIRTDTLRKIFLSRTAYPSEKITPEHFIVQFYRKYKNGPYPVQPVQIVEEFFPSQTARELFNDKVMAIKIMDELEIPPETTSAYGLLSGLGIQKDKIKHMRTIGEIERMPPETTPAYELLSTLGVQKEHFISRREMEGMVIYTMGWVPFPFLKSLEKATSDAIATEFIYHEGRLIAVFFIGLGQTFYLDFPPYYCNFTHGAELTTDYIKDISLLAVYIDSLFTLSVRKIKTYSPYIKANVDMETGEVSFETIDIETANLPNNTSLHGRKRSMVLPVFPTVYSPHVYRDVDIEYMKAIIKDPLFGLKNGDSVLVVGPGTGIDAWIASLITNEKIYAIGINPLEVANIRAVARIAGFEVEAIISDNIIDHDGVPAFKGRKFDKVMWSMPYFDEDPFSDNFKLDLERMYEKPYWDGDLGGIIVKRFAKGLYSVLKPAGCALIWNSYAAGKILKEKDLLYKSQAIYMGSDRTDYVLYFIRLPSLRDINKTKTAHQL